MAFKSTTTRVLIFIGSLRSGGKERRVIELLTYLKNKGGFEFLVVMTQDEIHYPDFFKLNIPYHVIKKKKQKNDLSVFTQFYKVCKDFRPDIIHTWGRMQSFYTLPAVIGQGIPLVNSQITAAPPKPEKWPLSMIDRLNFRFSKIILSNSKAGIDSYNPPANKWKVIYNGINMNRFKNLPNTEEIKAKYGIKTPYAVLMAASFTSHKDYDMFYRVADKVTKLRDDITFIGVGGIDKDDTLYKRMLSLSSDNPRITFPGRISDVEALVNACSLGVLFSNKAVHGEGISNAVMEYMTLAKPVIANDAGGTKEIVHHNKNGYLIINQPEEEVVKMIVDLINDQEKRELFGKASRQIIEETFSLDKMGRDFEQVYNEVLS